MNRKALKYKDTRSARTKPSTLITAVYRNAKYTVIHESTGCRRRHQWPGLNAVVVVESRRDINGQITDETPLLHYLAG